jgi:tetratricopeptide (TPR) repeat protein
VQLRAPLEAMRAYAADPSCRVTAETVEGVPLTALAIQRHYLALAHRHRRHPAMPPWAEEVCDRWAAVLDDLAAGPEAVATRVDWAIKLVLYRRHAQRRGFAWESVPHWSHVSSSVQAALAAAKCRAAASLDLLLARDGPIAPHVEQLGAYLGTHGLRWDDLPAFARLRQELFEIDFRFGQLGERGIFAALDRAGALDHRIAAPEEVDRAVAEPPAVGRARLRGVQVGLLSGQGVRYSCDWRGVWDQDTQRTIDLSDPFATQAEWGSWIGPGDDAIISPLAAHARELFVRARSRYGAGRYREGVQLFAEARQFAGAAGDHGLLGASLFWSATVLHGMGRLREAEPLLRELVRTPRAGVDDGVLYQALTRLALLLLELPRPLADIEHALQEAEERMAERGRGDRRSRIVLVRARLYEAQGAYDAALATVLESLELRRGDADAFAVNSHFRTLSAVCLRAGRLDDAAVHIERWAATASEYPRSKEILLACARSALARARGNADEAVALVERVAGYDEARADRANRLAVADAQVRALLAQGDLLRARAALLALAPLRRAEAGEDRHAFLLLWADYRLACPDRGSAARRRRAVQLACDQALGEARRLDALLACAWRTREVEARLASLDAPCEAEHISPRHGDGQGV